MREILYVKKVIKTMSVKLGERVFNGMQNKVNKILKGSNFMFTSNVS